jgi:hypothetical protein
VCAHKLVGRVANSQETSTDDCATYFLTYLIHSLISPHDIFDVSSQQ